MTVKIGFLQFFKIAEFFQAELYVLLSIQEFTSGAACTVRGGTGAAVRASSWWPPPGGRRGTAAAASASRGVRWARSGLASRRLMVCFDE